jgi:2-methylisocitrate lyase-like PEP mutase family enzyme
MTSEFRQRRPRCGWWGPRRTTTSRPVPARTPPTSLRDKALRFCALHRAGHALVLPNVWDVAGARLVEEAGAAAVATTSAGVAWSMGVADGDRLDRDRVADLVGRIASVAGVPVTTDIEGGYGETADDLAETVARVLGAGAVGVNIEDACHAGPEPLLATETQAERIAGAREVLTSGTYTAIAAAVDYGELNALLTPGT